jgi:hypothetical protein
MCRRAYNPKAIGPDPILSTTDPPAQSTRSLVLGQVFPVEAGLGHEGPQGFLELLGRHQE